MSLISPLNPQQNLLPVENQRTTKSATVPNEQKTKPQLGVNPGSFPNPVDTVEISEEGAAQSSQQSTTPDYMRDAKVANYLNSHENIAQLVRDGKMFVEKNAQGEYMLVENEALVYHPAREGTENTLTGISSSGTQVSVTRQPSTAVTDTEAATPPPSYSTTLTRSDGSSLSLSFTNSVYIQQGQDGSTSVYYSETDKTQFYGADGTRSETAGNTLASDADSIIINTVASNIQTGNGNTLIFNWADDTQITTGSGNDTLVLANHVRNNSISMGSGSDTVDGNYVEDSTINLGEGNNTLRIDELKSSHITAGNGNNYIDSHDKNGTSTESGSGFELYDSSVSLGNGNNTLHTQDVLSSSIHMGDGDNAFQSFTKVDGSSSISIGSGDNNITLGGVGNASVSIGNGSNNFALLSSSIFSGNPGSVAIGNGNNNLHLYFGENLSVNVGSGNNNISGSIGGSARVYFGNGNNRASNLDILDHASVTFGDGNNDIRLGFLSGHLKFGGGNNTVGLMDMLGDALLEMGDGNNNVFVGNMRKNASITMGDGDNFYVIGSMEDNASINTGSGNNWGLIETPSSSTTSLPADSHVLSDLSSAEIRQRRSEYANLLEVRQINPVLLRGQDSKKEWGRFHSNELGSVDVSA